MIKKQGLSISFHHPAISTFNLAIFAFPLMTPYYSHKNIQHAPRGL